MLQIMLGLLLGVPAPAEEPLPPPFVAPFKHQTANFEIEAPSEALARRAGDVAERQRRLQAERWLGKELPGWTERCPLKITIDKGSTGGSSTFTFEQGRVVSRRMQLSGTVEAMLASALPHEVMHTILADRFRRPVPRWADEGISVLAEQDKEIDRHGKLARAFLKNGRLLSVARMLVLREYPDDVLALYASGTSFTRFLLTRGDRACLLAFIEDGERVGWEKAARQHYGAVSLDKLEKDWVQYLRGSSGD